MNPIRYADFVSPDGSITDAIKQLEELRTSYGSLLETVKGDAKTLKANLEGLSGATKSHQESVKGAAAQTDALARAEKQLEFAMSENAKTLAKLKLALADKNKENKLGVQLNAAEEGSYNALSAQYSQNIVKLNAMSAATRQNTVEGKALEAETLRVRESMMKMNAAVGNHTLNVGNYGSATKMLGINIGQVMKELPNFAISARIGIMSLTNNLPMLGESIQAVIAQQKAMTLAQKEMTAAQIASLPNGGKIPSMFKLISQSVFGLTGALSIAMVFMQLYGAQIISWIGTLLKGKDALDKLHLSMKGQLEVADSLQRATMKGAEGGEAEIVHLGALYRATTNVSNSMHDRLLVAEKLKETYPKAFANFTAEEIALNKAKIGYDALRDSIIATANAKALEGEITDNATKRLDATNRVTGAQAQQNATLERAIKLQEQYAKTNDINYRFGKGFDPKTITVDKLMNLNSKAYQKEINEIKDWKKKEAEAMSDMHWIDVAQGFLQNKLDKTKPLDLIGYDSDKSKTKVVKDSTFENNKRNIDALKKQYADQDAMLQDSIEKKRAILIHGAIIDSLYLENSRENDKKLTIESKKGINAELINLTAKFNIDMVKLHDEQMQQWLNDEKNDLTLKLAVVEKGSLAENELKLKLITNARKQELLKNQQLDKDQRQDTAAINKKFDKEYKDQQLNFNAESQLIRLDQIQAAEKAEFDLMVTSEAEKTRFKLDQERDRAKKILELNILNNKELTDVQKIYFKALIEGIDKQIGVSRKDQKTQDIWAMLGIEFSADDEKNKAAKKAISDSMNYVQGQVNSFMQSTIALSQKKVDATQKEVDATKSALDKEIEARNNGYANSVDTARKEYENAQKRSQQAIEQQKKLQKAQQDIDTAMQVGSLITSAANIWKSLSAIPIIGVGLAIGAIGLMFGSFAAAKIRAKKATQSYGEGGFEFLEGGSHASGNDIGIGTMSDGRQRRAEGGETLAIIRKSQTQKYRGILPDIFNSLNKGTFENKYLNAFSHEGMQLNVAHTDTSTLEREVKSIREQGERKIYVDAQGRTIEIYKNLKRIIQ